MSLRTELLVLLAYLFAATTNFCIAYTRSSSPLFWLYVANGTLWLVVAIFRCDRLRWFTGLVLRCFIGRL